MVSYPWMEGRLFTIRPIVLFFLSFGLGYKDKSRLPSLLFILRGTMIVTFWLIAPTMGWFLFFYIAVRGVYNLIIVLGSIIIVLGVLRVFRQQWRQKKAIRKSMGKHNLSVRPTTPFETCS
jgi:putative Mn2+ efflux pump MntP